jgi:hypothetical protein
LKIVGILFALALVVSLVLVPVTVLAQEQGLGGLAKCELDPWPKWWDNPISHDLYLQNWGRTPIQAMSRLSGLCAPNSLCKVVGTNCPVKDACWPGGCPSCRDTDPGCLACCDDLTRCVPTECGVACAATSDAPAEGCLTCNEQRVFENKLPHCAGCWGVSLAFAAKSWAGADISDKPMFNNTISLPHFGTSECTGGNQGGDWGVTGCPHTECCSLSWCLQDNCFTGGCAGK